ncbi:EamA family transporter RarD [Pseudomonas alkylphenolica]|uniref:EamA family transporter RarD n=1 Tax=Pseudomonas alkylphenolica TaxID=237609 RepID=A0A443ZR00_9PSED|nr:EamA family transporter RarD [Pseudomonas alkylphenolica]RWU21513.1 EamA family transporter RarD [Pseudomonas alkylphenolica]
MHRPATANVALGVLLNVLASVLFAVMYAYTHLLKPLDGEEIYGWRMLLTAPCLTLMLLVSGRWHEVRRLFQRLRHEHGFWLVRVLSSALLGAQLWLFMWAPINGYGLDVSLGYFLMPLTMAIFGRLAFKDTISRLQLLACAVAAVGVINQIAIAKAITWPVLAVSLGYPVYFWLRRVSDSNTMGGLWFDMTLSLPVSLYFVLKGGVVLGVAGSGSALPWLVAGLGAISASALALQALSGPRLNLTLFGLLIYVEPVLLVLASILLGETIAPAQWPTYIAIWLAMLVLMVEGGLSLNGARRGYSPSRCSREGG